MKYYLLSETNTGESSEFVIPYKLNPCLMVVGVNGVGKQLLLVN
jgi:fused signal recognition particle receptor